MDQNRSILASCTSGGCGSKIGPGELADLLQHINLPQHQDLLVGFDSSDDAAVYRLDAERSLVATVDFFSPMVDDPHLFGRIAATNALSDVYAMGARPILALNLVAFPSTLPKEMLAEILAGGAEKITEAQAVLGGGHSIYDKEPKYGLAVNGIVETQKIIRNNTPHVGDLLILTKALGIGLVMAAHRDGSVHAEAYQRAIESMQRLNRYAAQAMMDYPIHACTDVTGFGLLAHLLEMCGQHYSAKIFVQNLPMIGEALTYAQAGLITAAGKRNRQHFGHHGDLSSLSLAMQELLFDPQTSGGLLISVPQKDALALLQAIQTEDPDAAIIAEILPKDSNTILFS